MNINAALKNDKQQGFGGGSPQLKTETSNKKENNIFGNFVYFIAPLGCNY